MSFYPYSGKILHEHFKCIDFIGILSRKTEALKRVSKQ